MDALGEIAALIAALAFAVLVIYLAMVLKAVQRTMNDVADTMEGMEKQLEGITTESAALLSKTNRLAEDISDKSQRLNTLVDGVQGIGESVKDFNNTLRTVSNQVSVAADNNKETAAQAMNWGTVAMKLWKQKKNLM